MPYVRFLALLSAFVLIASPAAGQKKSKKQRQLEAELSLDPPVKGRKTIQVLEVVPEPPQAVIVDSARLSFHVTPLSAKGLLSQQTEDALKWLLGSVRGATVQKIRAFVAGSGDLRRVQSIVTETMGERRLPLPAMTVVQVGGLPLEGAQVVLEAVAVEKKPATPHGVAFVAGQSATAKDASGPVTAALKSADIAPSRVRRVTCFLNSLEHAEQVRTQITAAFPEAASNFVQLRRDSLGDFVECEAVAALSRTPEKPVTFLGAMEGRYSQVVSVGPGKLAISGTQLAFGYEENDVRLAFGRLDKALESVKADMKRVVMSSVYPLTNSVSEKVRKLRFEHYDAKTPPASTLILFEGLPSVDASVAIDVIARLQD